MHDPLSLHFLGTGNAQSLDLGCSSCVLERDGAPLLTLDCGPDTVRQFAHNYPGQLPAAADAGIEAAAIVPDTVVANGARVPGTSHVLDPVKAAWDIGAMIRWLDFNDTWLAAEWGHPSDNLGGILAVADYLSRKARADGGASALSREVPGTPQVALTGNSLNDVAWNGVDRLVAVGDAGLPAVRFPEDQPGAGRAPSF